MQSLSKRDQILFVFLVALVIGYGYFRFILTPVLNQINTVNSEISQSKEKISTLDVTAITNKKLKKQLEDLGTKFKENEKAIPYLARQPELITGIKKFSDDAKVNFVSFNFKGNTEYTSVDSKTQGETNTANTTTTATSTTTGNLMVIPITFVFNGDFANVISFINTLEGDKRLSSIDSVSLIPNTATNSVQANVSLNYYYIDTGKKDLELKYDLMDGIFGKDSLFK